MSCLSVYCDESESTANGGDKCRRKKNMAHVEDLEYVQIADN